MSRFEQIGIIILLAGFTLEFVVALSSKIKQAEAQDMLANLTIESVGLIKPEDTKTEKE